MTVIAGRIVTPGGTRQGWIRIEGESLVGSAITVLDAVRWATSIGIPLPEAVYAASVAPARAVGLTDWGELAPGARADVLLVDDELRPTAVMRRGRWL